MQLFSAAKKEVAEQQSAILAAARATLTSLKLQTSQIAKSFPKIPAPSTLESQSETASTLQLNWLTPAWTTVLDASVAQATDLAYQSCASTDSTTSTASHIPDTFVCGVCYELRYYKTGATLASWILVKDIDTCQCSVPGLLSNTSYTFEIRANLYIQAKGYPHSNAAAAGECKEQSTSATTTTTTTSTTPLVPRCLGSTWSEWQASTALLTLTSEQHERTVFEQRLVQYLTHTMAPYPPFVRKDTAYHKAERVGDATFHTLSKVPLLGSYASAVKAAKTLWDVRKIGLVSLVFSQELAQVAAVLAGLASSVRTTTGLTTKDMTVGAYYLLWIRRGIRLVNPMHEAEEHAVGVTGVIAAKAPDAMLQELSWFAPLAFASYGSTPDHVQWLVNQHPPTHSSTHSSSGNNARHGFTLIGSSPYSARVSNHTGVFKPAYNIMAHRQLGIAVFSIRGSQSVEDFLADADATVSTDVELCGVKGSCHGGILKSAQWLAEEGGVCAMLKTLHDAGHHKIVFTGHSLGAGVAVLLALLTKSKYGLDMLDISVYGYAMPACLDEGLADAVCGCGVGHVADGVVVRALVNKDDIVSRLSVANATELAVEIQARREDWAPFLSSDLNGVMQRAMTLWAPHQRGRHNSGSKSSEDTVDLSSGRSQSASSVNSSSATATTTTTNMEVSTKEGTAAADSSSFSSSSSSSTSSASSSNTYDPSKTNRKSYHNDDNIKDESKLISNILEQNLSTSRLVVPGSICHTYSVNGQTHCALINHRHPSLRRIEAYSTCTRDHVTSSLLLSMREVSAARAPSCKRPPQWESMRTDADVTCSVCSYNVSWSVTGKAATETARATHHCRCCGTIVCKDCSMHKIALPMYGMLSPERVCDVCYVRSPMESMGGMEAVPVRWEPTSGGEEEEENEKVDVNEKWY